MQYVAWMERQFNACRTPRSMYLSIFNSFRVIRCLSQCVSPKIAIFTTFLFPLADAPGAITLSVPIYLKQFPSYSNHKCKKLPFSRTAAHIFVSPREAPATITQYVAWMERQVNARQTPRSMYLSIFNSFRVIRCSSQCVSPKIAIFTTFLFSLGTLLG